MSERGVFVVFIAGLLLTMAGVGGVENSVTNGELFSSVLVAVLGLLAMFAATQGMKQLNNP